MTLLLDIQTGFNMEEILRKYIRYALNENPFNPELVANLIHLRKVSMLDDSQVAETLQEISRRIVKDKGNFVLQSCVILHVLVHGVKNQSIQDILMNSRGMRREYS